MDEKNPTEVLGSTGITETPNTNNIQSENIINNQKENLEPVKPTLDSILNGGTETIQPVVTENTIEEPKIDTLETLEEPTNTTEAVNQNTVVEPPKLEQQPEVTSSVNLNNINNIPIEENVTTETLDMPAVETPVEQPIEEIAPLPNTVPVTPVSLDPIQSDFNAVPAPPVLEEDEKSKKKGNKNILIIILIVVLIAAIGFGVYYFLNMTKNMNKNSMIPKEIKLELGSTLSKNIDDYVTITGYNKNECSILVDNVDINNVSLNKVGTYKYVVTCKKENVEGIIIVDDTEKPFVVTNDLTVSPNATINPEDFIIDCIDASKCNYKLSTDINSTLGLQEVNLTVTDEYNNATTTTVNLNVTNNAPTRYISCIKEESDNTISATVKETYKIGVNTTDYFVNALRIREMKFNSQNDYQNYLTNNSTTTEKMTSNEKQNKIYLVGNKTINDMNTDLNGNLPENVNILKAYMSGIGYTCN